MSKLISTQLYFNSSSISTLLQLKFDFNSTSTHHQLNPNHKSISISASTQPQPKLNLNLQSNPGSSQPQLNFSLNISLNHNLNSIWLWHKSNPILFWKKIGKHNHNLKSNPPTPRGATERSEVQYHPKRWYEMGTARHSDRPRSRVFDSSED